MLQTHKYTAEYEKLFILYLNFTNHLIITEPITDNLKAFYILDIHVAVDHILHGHTGYHEKGQQI